MTCFYYGEITVPDQKLRIKKPVWRCLSTRACILDDAGSYRRLRLRPVDWPAGDDMRPIGLGNIKPIIAPMPRPKAPSI